MCIDIHTVKTYKDEFGPIVTSGYENTNKFINHLEELSKNPDSEIWINEDSSIIEIPFKELEKMKDNPEWGTTVELIINNSDHDNDFARIEIW